MNSLRTRLLLGTSLASIVVLTLLGIGVYAAMRHALIRDFDNSLLTEARLVSSMVDQDGTKVTFEFDPQQAPEFSESSPRPTTPQLDREGVWQFNYFDGPRRYFQVWRQDGSVLARSPSLVNQELPKPSAAGPAADVRLPNFQIGRMRVITFSPAQQEQEDHQPLFPPQTVTIAVAGEPTEVDRTLTLLASLLAVLCTAAVAVMGFVLIQVVRRATRPIGVLAREIESLKETDLARRLPAGSVPTELTPIVDKLNGLLTRLAEAFAREKSFTADVAHELRTPLAGLRSTLEVCRSRPRDAGAYESALDDCRGITDRMEAMVQSLLLLARSDAGQVAVQRRELDLADLVRQIWCQFQYRADRRGVTVSLSANTPCPATTDPDQLQIVLANLFDNAVSYVNDAGQIRITVAQNNGVPQIEITNTGSQIPPEDAPRLFERFWRGDSARTDSGLHCGLGLSLSQRLTTLLGGQISIHTVKDGDFAVLLCFPSRC